MWQVRCQRQHLVMVICVHALAHRPQAGDKPLEPHHLLLRNVTRQDKPVAPVKQLGKAGSGAGMFGAGKRM